MELKRGTLEPPWAEVAEIPDANHQLGIYDHPSRVPDEIRAFLHRLT